MLDVIIALTPALIAATVIFGGPSPAADGGVRRLLRSV